MPTSAPDLCWLTFSQTGVNRPTRIPVGRLHGALTDQVKNTDPNGRDCFSGMVPCPNYILGGVGALANVVTTDIVNAPNRLIDAAISPFTSFRFGDLAAPAFAPTNEDQRQGMVAGYAVTLLSPLAEISAAKATTAAVEVHGALVLRNSAQGRAFQNAVAADTALTDTNVVQNITMRTQTGVRTQMDVVSTNSAGQIVLTEAKSSQRRR